MGDVLFDLLVGLGKINGKLGEELKLLMAKGHGEDWNGTTDQEIDRKTYDFFKEELYALLVD